MDRPEENLPVAHDSSGLARVGQPMAGPLGLPLLGLRVAQVRIDQAFSLLFDGRSSGSWLLRLEGEFAVRLPAGDLTTFAENATPGQLGVAAERLLQRTVATASATEAGGLALTFSDRTGLSAPTHPRWESWTLTGPGGALVVCGPDGHLSQWEAAAHN
jgi:hypothetical protein